MTAAIKPIAVLISGRGSNLRALIEDSKRAPAPYRVSAVASDQPTAAGLQIAAQSGIPIEVLAADGFANRRTYDEALERRLAPYGAQLIVLAGFMRILSAELVARFTGRMLNIHPSLLPAYPGLHSHRRVLEAGDTMHGATVHFVTPELDAGPRILRARVPVRPGDDTTSLSARVQTVEHKIYPMAVRWFCEERLQLRDGSAWLDGIQLREPAEFEVCSMEPLDA